MEWRDFHIYPKRVDRGIIIKIKLSNRLETGKSEKYQFSTKVVIQEPKIKQPLESFINPSNSPAEKTFWGDKDVVIVPRTGYSSDSMAPLKGPFRE